MFMYSYMPVWEKVPSENGVNVVFFIFFINFFVETLIKSIIYCQTVPLDCLLTYILKIVCQASLPSFLTWVNLAIFCLDQSQMIVSYSTQHQFHWYLGDNWLLHKLSVMAAVDLRVMQDIYTQHPALKSGYGKSQPVVRYFQSTV